jgi:hypothetical protein
MPEELDERPDAVEIDEGGWLSGPCEAGDAPVASAPTFGPETAEDLARPGAGKPALRGWHPPGGSL